MPATSRDTLAAVIASVGSVLGMVRDVAIRGEMIRLGQLLKLVGVIDTGAEVKAFLAGEPVLVNGERETRRGRQLHPGDVIEVGERDLRVKSTRGSQRASSTFRPGP